MPVVYLRHWIINEAMFGLVQIVFIYRVGFRQSNQSYYYYCYDDDGGTLIRRDQPEQATESTMDYYYAICAGQMVRNRSVVISCHGIKWSR